MGDPAPARPSAISDPQDVYGEFRRPLLVLALTTGIAGFVDAFAFLRYGAFVANQSGNAVLLGIGLAGRHAAWPESAASLIAFAAGTGVVSQVRAARSPWSPSLRGLACAVAHAGALGGAQRPAPPRPAGRAAADRAGRRGWLRHGRAGDPVRPHGRDHHPHHLPVGHGGEDRRTRRALARRTGHPPEAGPPGHLPRAPGTDSATPPGVASERWRSNNHAGCRPGERSPCPPCRSCSVPAGRRGDRGPRRRAPAQRTSVASWTSCTKHSERSAP